MSNNNHNCKSTGCELKNSSELNNHLTTKKNIGKADNNDADNMILILVIHLSTLSELVTWPMVLFQILGEYCRNIPPPVCYIFGGHANNDECIRWVNNKWCNDLPPLPTKERYDCGVCNIGDSIYVVGGTNSMGSALSNVDRLHLPTMKWSSSRAIPEARHGHGCISVNGDIYCLGGYDNDFSEVNSMIRYDTKEDTWVNAPSMEEKRERSSYAVLGDHIFVFGGLTTNSCEMFNITNNRWEKIASLSHNRSSACAVVVDNDTILLLGGHVNGRVVDTVEEYSHKSNSWRTLSWRLPEPRSRFAAWYDTNNNNNALYITSGLSPSIYIRQPIDTGTWTLVAICPAGRQSFGWTIVV
jgi:N-acetylneuraminic acid mutarotase